MKTVCFNRVSLPVGIDSFEQVRHWCDEHFDRVLLILGDSTKLLLPYSQHWGVFECQSNTPIGLAVRFSGFRFPVVSIAADRLDVINDLLNTVCCGNEIVAVNTIQQLPPHLESAPQSIDSWLVAPCDEAVNPLGVIEALHDECELRTFYDEQGIQFWTPAMTQAGFTFGIRGPDKKLVSAGGVNFILPRFKYAQIGALATHSEHRGRLYASNILETIRSNLTRVGIQTCGLFVDATNQDLLAFYKRRGFFERGKFRFVDLRSRP